MSTFDYVAAFKQNQFKEIVDTWISSNFVAPLDPPFANVVACSYYKLGDFESSFKLLTEIQSFFENDINYLCIMGSVSRRLNNFDVARLSLEKALELDSTRATTRNNYANLLIDLREYDEAHSILTDLVSSDPTYSDAQFNLNRLNSFLNSPSSTDSRSSVAAAANNTQSNFSMADPLLSAFAPSEVQRTIQMITPKKESVTSPVRELESQLPDIDVEKIIGEKLQLARQANLESNYHLSLRFCKDLLSSLGSSSELYECAADSYIGLQLFPNAEICLLHSIAFGSGSFKAFANLTTLSLLRGDKHTAQFYYDKAAKLDPNNESLAPLHTSLTQVSQRFDFPTDWSATYPDDLSSKKTQ